eukprot:scaffold1154_cov310-Pinguiococcus_pyrenoidosus.AAC.49
MTLAFAPSISTSHIHEFQCCGKVRTMAASGFCPTNFRAVPHDFSSLLNVQILDDLLGGIRPGDRRPEGAMLLRLELANERLDAKRFEPVLQLILPLKVGAEGPRGNADR